MEKKLFTALSGALAVVLFLAGTALAERPALGGVRHETKADQMENKKDAAMEQKDAMEKRKAMIEQERMERKADLEERHTEAKESAEMKHKEFEKKAAAIHDEQKKNRAIRLASHFNELNGRLTKHFADVLEKLDKVLDRIGERTDRFEKRGTNVADVRAATKKAEAAIAAAVAKVADQTKKVYEVKFTNTDKLEEKLKGAFTAVREQFEKDIEATRGAVQDARDAVHVAAVAYGKAHGEDRKKPEPQPAPAPAPTPPSNATQ